MSHVMNTYARQPVAFARGQGVWLWDEAGKKYLDALAGIAVNTLGHNHPRLVRALSEQIARVMHTSNLFRIPAAGGRRQTASPRSPAWTKCSSAIPGWKPTSARSRLRASTDTTAASPSPRSS
jgi:acetylornithine/succinyldiaminopimelate/putrescine aminotransferase